MKPNQYPTSCSVCKAHMPANTGVVSRNENGRWIGYCHLHKGDAPKDAPEPETPEFSPEYAAETPEEVTPDHTVLDALLAKALAEPFTHKHEILPKILLVLLAGGYPAITGPAGSGKSTIARQCAHAFEVPFYMANRVSYEQILTGYHDANGNYVRSQFRDAYENGGVFLLDEFDASDPDVFTALNAALAGDIAAFPDGLVQRHPQFYCIAAGNTLGRGADRTYVGRTQQDGASLDRFIYIEMEYDEAMEMVLANNDGWTHYVQRMRAKADKQGVRHIISPRASIMGAKLLAVGLSLADVQNMVVWKGLDQQTVDRITSA